MASLIPENDSRKKIELTSPPVGKHITVDNAAGATLLFKFDIFTTTRIADGDNLVLRIPENGSITIVDFFLTEVDEVVAVEMPNGNLVIGFESFAFFEQALTEGVQNTKSNGSSGLPEYQEDSGDLIDTVTRLDKLDPFYWGYTSEQEKTDFGTLMDDNLFVVVLGSLNAVFSMHEDGMPNKNNLAQGADPATGPADTTLETDYDPATGMPIHLSLNGASSDVSVFTITIGQLPGTAQGVLFYLGQPILAGQVISNPDLSGFSFKPTEFFSGDTTFNFSYKLTSPSTGPATNSSNAKVILHVDSVADLPEAESQATGQTANGDHITLDAAVFKNGWATQTALGENATSVTFDIIASFNDLDGSEIGWIDIKLPQGFTVPPGQTDASGNLYEVIYDSTGVYARIHTPDFMSLQGSSGEYTLPVTLTMDSSATTLAKDLIITVHVVESDTLDSDGHSIGNNEAIRTIDQIIVQDVLPGTLVVKAGWSYEGNKYGGDATADITTLELEGDTTSMFGAPITFSFSNGNITGGTITIDPGQGALYIGNIPLTGSGGVYTLSETQINSGTLCFRPSGYGDGDVVIEYVLDAQSFTGANFTFTGDTTVVIDAVADVGTINSAPTAVVEPNNMTFDVTVTATFTDVDGSENHYIMVERADNWTSSDPHDVVVIYFDNSGNPLKPVAFDPSNPDYEFDLGDAAYYIEFLRFDVTAQSIIANGSPTAYVVSLIPAANSGDIDLKVATMSEEKTANLEGREYDAANNLAFAQETVFINFPDSAVFMSGNPAYENHAPDQYEGTTTPVTSDGIINVSLTPSQDTFDTTPLAEIIFTFTYDGPGDPGSFTNITNSTTISFSDPGYTQIGPNEYQIIIPIATSGITPGTTEFGFRYNPPTDDDTDLTNINIEVPVIANGSGASGQQTGYLEKLIVDAVANKPTSVTLTPEYEPSLTAVQSGGDIDMELNVQFGDFTDGSEEHFLVFDYNSGLASIDPLSLPSGVTILSTEADRTAEGLGIYTDTDRYFVVKVSNAYLQSNGGVFNETITAGIDTVTIDRTLDLKYIAVSVDHKTDEFEVKTNNNFSITPCVAIIDVHAVTSVPVLHAGVAFENSIPKEHIGGADHSGAGALSLSGMHPSEYLESLAISFDIASGLLLSSDSAINGAISTTGSPYTLSNGLTLTCAESAGKFTITIVGGSSAVDVATEVSKLGFSPSGSYSDKDVPLEYSGNIIDAASGLEKNFTGSAPITVVVDAVAQQPTDVTGTVAYPDDGSGGTFTAASTEVTITAEATFRDTGDGSEKHYLLIEAKNYFDTAGLVGANGIALTTVGYDGSGNPLTPGASGGWLNPNPSSHIDQSVTASSTKSFIQVPVDTIIALYDTGGAPTQMFGDFTVTKELDNSFTVSYTKTIDIKLGSVPADISQQLVVGGMSVEEATVSAGDSYGGNEAYRYNDVAYSLVNKTIDVAVVETTQVVVIPGWAREENAPRANVGDYTPGDGAGMLAIRTAPGNGSIDYSSEELTITFTYSSLYKDADTGDWVPPGTIEYTFPGSAAVTTAVDPTTGVVTATVIISTGDTSSVIRSLDFASGQTAQETQVDNSHIRFIPGDNFNEADVNMSYMVSAEDVGSGAQGTVGNGAFIVIVDAVADQPQISNVGWAYGTDENGTPYEAFTSENVVLSFIVDFPDTGTNGVISEGQFILIQENTLIDLSPAFKLAVAQAGYTIEHYVVAGDSTPYYRIPAAFFQSDPDTHTYHATIPLVVTGSLSEGNLNSHLVVYAQAIVQQAHGAEGDFTNNSSQVPITIPDIEFSFVGTTVTGGQSSVYEDDTPNSHTGDYTAAGGVDFNLGLTLGSSLASGGVEIVSDITFTYDTTHGTLSYFNGSTVVNVPSGGQVPAAYQDQLTYVPINSLGHSGFNGQADKDQLLHYTLTATDPASGATKTISGDYKIVVDAVADKPVDLTLSAPDYSSGTGMVGFGESVGIAISVNFQDFEKSASNHSMFYILVQQPGFGWSTSAPGATEFIYGNELYFRIPVDPSAIDSFGTASMNISLTAPSTGLLFYADAQPLNIYGQSVARDPNLNALLPGDEEITYSNNFAYSDAGSLTITYDPGTPSDLYIEPLYENNKPNANILGPDGHPVSTTAGGKVHLLTEYGPSDTPVDHVVITWNDGQGDLFIGGLIVTGTLQDDGTVSYTIPSSDLGNVVFQNNQPPTNSDIDWDPVTVEYYGSVDDSDLLGSASYTPIVDAVAQVSTNLSSTTDYGLDQNNNPYTAAAVGDPVDIQVTATFHDLGSDSDRFVLVEFKPGWSLPPGDNHTIITGPDGKDYWQVPVDDSDIDPGTGEVHITVPVIPPTTGGTVGNNGQMEFNLNTGAMTERNPTDIEYRGDNNVSYNLTGNTTVVTSTAESNPVLHVTDTYAGNDNTGSGTPNPNLSSNLYISGLNTSSDNISEVTLTYLSVNGTIEYSGVPLSNSTPGVTVTDTNGVSTIVITDPGIINALVTGNAGFSSVQYVPQNYIDSDIPVTGSFVVNDNFSTDSKTINSNDTIVVDAVALQPTDVVMEITDPNYNGSVDAGVEVPFTLSATFHDLGNTDATHSLAIQQLSGWTFSGPLPPEITIETYDGITYYMINVDLYGNGQSPYLTNNGNGNYTFNVSLFSPTNFTDDLQGVSNIKSFAIVVERPIDQEVTFTNNSNVVAQDFSISIGVVQTNAVNFVLDPIAEDLATTGIGITLGLSDKSALMTNNEKVTETTLTFSGNFTGYASGAQVATVIYDSVAYPVLSNGDGTASVHVSFGTEGYDSLKNFNVVWGTVATDGSGNVQYTGIIPDVTSWNHTGSDMTVTSNSTVVDIASNATKPNIAGTGSVTFISEADAPTDLEATPPNSSTGSGTPVAFEVSGVFVDIDGSEQHAFLVEQQPGWSGSYQTIIIEDITYFVVPITDSTNGNPSAVVILNSPPNTTVDGSVSLIVSGMATDGMSTNASTTTTTVTIDMSVVNAIGLNLTMSTINENQGSGSIPSQMSFSLDGTGANDTITSITITDLQGGTIVDSGGNVLFSITPAVLDVNLALNSDYYYMPPLNGNGNFTIGFTAIVKDSISNTTATFANQYGSVTVIDVFSLPMPEEYQPALTVDMDFTSLDSFAALVATHHLEIEASNFCIADLAGKTEGDISNTFASAEQDFLTFAKQPISISGEGTVTPLAIEATVLEHGTETSWASLIENALTNEITVIDELINLLAQDEPVASLEIDSYIRMDGAILLDAGLFSTDNDGLESINTLLGSWTPNSLGIVTEADFTQLVEATQKEQAESTVSSTFTEATIVSFEFAWQHAEANLRDLEVMEKIKIDSGGC